MYSIVDFLFRFNFYLEYVMNVLNLWLHNAMGYEWMIYSRKIASRRYRISYSMYVAITVNELDQEESPCCLVSQIVRTDNLSLRE